MTTQQNKEKLKDIGRWFASPVGIVVMVVIVMFLVLIGVSAKMIRDATLNHEASWVEEEYDPASDTMIQVLPQTTDAPQGPRYVGFELLMDNGITGDLISLLKGAINTYATNENIELSRVSYLKDTYKLIDSYVFEFSVVLNVDQNTLKVRLDSSAGWKNILGAKVQLTDTMENEVLAIEVTEDNICQYTEEVECGYDGT